MVWRGPWTGGTVSFGSRGLGELWPEVGTVAWRGTVVGWGHRGRAEDTRGPSGEGGLCPQDWGRGAVWLSLSPPRSQPWFTGPGESWAAPGGGALLPPRARPAPLEGRPGAGFAEGRGFWLAQGSGPQWGRNLTVRRQPAGVRLGPATPPWGLPGQVWGERGPRDFVLFPRVRLSSASMRPEAGSACAVGGGRPSPFLWCGPCRHPSVQQSVSERGQRWPPSRRQGSRTGSRACSPPCAAGPAHTVLWACELQPPGPFVFISLADPARSPALAGPWATGLLAS